ncbi:hypothetical protein K491DRAFT_731321 [Lophiostoma macrostomum CBS 122681]|uniref:Uncharacterized protein n=1 Tax=Lophiostoma macrostomum CBS 122681 TaxID=1314788 RepID=A0A6A6SWG3_9PLEO|nr:hypothetical protein K491DRAFT_731321 [Lophiostoma macrostomum CBS 122681]
MQTCFDVACLPPTTTTYSASTFSTTTTSYSRSTFTTTRTVKSASTIDQTEKGSTLYFTTSATSVMSIRSSESIATQGVSQYSSTSPGDPTLSKPPPSSTVLASPQSDGSGLSLGAIAGLTIGCTLIVLLAAGFVIREHRKRKELAARVLVGSATRYEKAELDGHTDLDRTYIDVAELMGDGLVRELEGSVLDEGSEGAAKG